MSQVPRSQYTGFSQLRKIRRPKTRGFYSRPSEKLPEYVQNNLNTIKFGIKNLPSDNMNKVMKGTFQNDYVEILNQKHQINSFLSNLSKRQE
jgi:hypothetical protein